MRIFIVQRAEASQCRYMDTVTKLKQEKEESMGSD
jgi:hypothetical protein